MKKLLYLSVVLLLLLSACADDKGVLEVLDRAESLMEEHPDSSYALLVECDSLIPQQSRRVRMHHLMLVAEAANKLYRQMPSDTLFLEAVDYYDHHGTPNQQLKAHYLLGCIYRDMKEAPQAIQCYYDAMEKADTLRDDCDYTTLFRVYGQMAELFRAQYLSEDELKAWKQYSHYAQKANDTYNYIYGLEQTVIPYLSMRDTAQVLEVTKKCNQLYEKNGMPQAAAHVFRTVIFLYLENSQYEKAHELMNLVENKSDLFDEQGRIREGQEHYYYSKGLYYIGVCQIDSAEYYYRKLQSYGYEYDAYKGLLSVYQAKTNSDSIAKYATLCEKGLEQLLSENQMEAVMQLSSLYNYTRNQKLAMEKTQEAEHERFIKWRVLIISLLITTIGILQYTRYKRKKVAELRKMGTDYANTFTQLIQAQNELSALKESYSNLKDGLLLKKQKEINLLNTKIQEYQSMYQDMKTHEKEAVVYESDIVKRFKEMATFKRGSQLPQEHEWEKLVILLKQCMPLFYQNMIERHQLAGQEQRTCILTFLNFSASETSILLNTSPQRITNVKMHINKKIFGEDNATNLYKNLKNDTGVK